MRLRKSGDSPTCYELFWRPGRSVEVLFEFFRIFRLTMVVVKEREVPGKPTPWLSALHSNHFFVVALAIELCSGTSLARLSSLFTKWFTIT